MRKFLYSLLAVCAAGVALVSCNADEQTTWDQYTTYRDNNQKWLEELQAKKDSTGQPYYKTIVPAWNPGAYVLIHYFNDRKLTEGNLSPMYTSTVDVRYKGYRYNGTMFDESTNNTSPAPGIFRTQLNQVVSGWTIALSDMRCKDTAEIIVPYQFAYGENGVFSADTILPYSNLRFNVRLVDIYKYEASPY